MSPEPRQPLPHLAEPALSLEPGTDHAAVAVAQDTASFVTVDSVAGSGGGIDQIMVADSASLQVFGDGSDQSAVFTPLLDPNAAPVVLAAFDPDAPFQLAMNDTSTNSSMGSGTPDSPLSLDIIYGSGAVDSQIWGSTVNDGMSIHSLSNPIHDSTGGSNNFLAPSSFATASTPTAAWTPPAPIFTPPVQHADAHLDASSQTQTASVQTSTAQDSSSIPISDIDADLSHHVLHGGFVASTVQEPVSDAGGVVSAAILSVGDTSILFSGGSATVELTTSIVTLDVNAPQVFGDSATIVGSEGGVPFTLAGQDGSVVVGDNGTWTTISGSNGATLLYAGDQQDTLIGNAGGSEGNTFILAGIDGGTSSLVTVQNFGPAHDIIDIPASVYAGLGTAAVTSGTNENVFVLANDAAATAYNGATAAVLVVGSGSNADVYYYNPHDPNFGNQAHAYQLATIAGTNPTDVAGHVSFANLVGQPAVIVNHST